VSDPFGNLLTVEVREDPRCTYVCPAGELDMAVCGRIEREVEALLDAGCPMVVLDLRELTFADSSGVRELLRCRDAALARGARLALTLEPGAVSRALEVCGVLDLFEVQAP
jgi:anti-sigma B factor antagonist